MGKFNEKLDRLNANLNNFFAFVGSKLRNFSRLSLGEQISYSSIGMGLVLIIVSLVLFVI